MFIHIFIQIELSFRNAPNTYEYYAHGYLHYSFWTVCGLQLLLNCALWIPLWPQLALPSFVLAESSNHSGCIPQVWLLHGCFFHCSNHMYMLATLEGLNHAENVECVALVTYLSRSAFDYCGEIIFFFYSPEIELILGPGEGYESLRGIYRNPNFFSFLLKRI